MKKKKKEKRIKIEEDKLKSSRRNRGIRWIWRYDEKHEKTGDEITVVRKATSFSLANMYRDLLPVSSRQIKETVGSSQTSVCIYHTFRHHIPDNSKLHSQSNQNLRCNEFKKVHTA